MKISIITAVYNSETTISGAIDSVANQDSQVEHVVIDGMSNDGSDRIIAAKSDKISKAIREPDNGIYDALNKGIAYSTGDIVGFLHADDLLADAQVTTRIKNAFSDGVQAVYSDLVYVNANDTQQIIRYWRGGEYKRSRFRFGWMPPHPTVYVAREVYEKLGTYRTDLGSAADYECLIRLMYLHKIKVKYLPFISVKMRVGGESNATIGNRLKANHSDRSAWIENGLKPPLGIRLTKPMSKLPQYFLRPSNDCPEF